MSTTTSSNCEMRTLTDTEMEQVNGAILANIGMGIAGAATWMAGYAMGNYSSLSGSGFMSAAAGGFVWGAGGMNHASGVAGAVVAGAVSHATSGGGGGGNISIEESRLHKAD